MSILSRIFGTSQEERIKALGFTSHDGHWQSSMGFFARHHAEVPTAAEILVIIRAALKAEGIIINFGKFKKSNPSGEGWIDAENPYTLQAIRFPIVLTIGVRIDREHNKGGCNGFVPEEVNGGFGIIARVQLVESQKRWEDSNYFHSGEEFIQEIFSSEDLCSPDCNLEVAVLGIKRIMDGLDLR